MPQAKSAQPPIEALPSTLPTDYIHGFGYQLTHRTPTVSRRVTVVGGRGVMGQFFVQQFAAAGHVVNILEQDNWSEVEQILDGADLVLLCVPIEFTVQVIRTIAPYLSQTTALADITSVKTSIVQAMMECHNGPVMGLHPMFGPKVQSFESQNIVVCPGRGDEAFQWLLDLMKREGGKLIVRTPEEHDEIMVVVQAIRHFISFSFGIFLAEEGADIDQSWELSSPSYRELIRMTNQLFSHAPELVADIMLFSPERTEAIGRLADTFSRLAKAAKQGDRDALIQEFKAGQQVWGNVVC